MDVMDAGCQRSWRVGMRATLHYVWCRPYWERLMREPQATPGERPTHAAAHEPRRAVPRNRVAEDLRTRGRPGGVRPVDRAAGRDHAPGHLPARVRAPPPPAAVHAQARAGAARPRPSVLDRG